MCVIRVPKKTVKKGNRKMYNAQFEEVKDNFSPLLNALIALTHYRPNC